MLFQACLRSLSLCAMDSPSQELQEQIETDREMAMKLQAMADNSRMISALGCFTCLLCKEECSLDKCLTEFKCGHRLCKDCSLDFVESVIDHGTGSASDLSCPEVNDEMKRCGEPMTEEQLQLLLTPKQYERFNRLRIRNLSFGEDEERIECPIMVNKASCGALFIIGKDQKKVTCPTCEKTICLACMAEAHTGTCEEYQKWKAENSQADEKFVQFTQKENCQRCPTCKAWGKLGPGDGCNCIRCQTRQCRSQTSFCNHCGQLIKSTDHSMSGNAHFGIHGSYATGCVNKPNPGSV
ncbi:unnamed protein product [Vitrella brassicaformis CCMP3155]|uniref:RBR-type E3 ubiquitin transferase n=1 Tax=Vitrella brassicaformis (strain CCMP3155) TaxID=1169540 RepID=A0A0G4EN58_VITBC|nr:unnamed protein product [Vitrella brassicaformis CCMP3155]|eukprot:CEL98464.1 unnamed protein product [Vitrella brassicaformis CCMP3155]